MGCTRLALFVCVGSLATAGSAAPPAAPPAGLTIAFIGDQDVGSDAEAVLQLILEEGADAVLHSGDLGYSAGPAAWEAQVDAVLGPDFPYFASVGNHDADDWYGSGGYQQRLAARMARLGIEWQGDLGVQSSLHWNGIFILLTAPDVFGAGDGFHDLYLRGQLAADASRWRISSWHRNMRLMQVGDKSDDTGWGVYEQSRRGGAIVATAHEHSYSRTHLMSSFETQQIASSANSFALVEDDPNTPADEGRSFAFVSGLAGRSIRNQELDGAWWASIYTSTQGANFGVLFGAFGYGGDPDLARFSFRDIDGMLVDEFFVRSGRAPAAPVPSLRASGAALLAALLCGSGLALTSARSRRGRCAAVAALAALLAAAPAGAEWVDWIADAQLDARYDSNLNQAARASEEEWDLAFLPSIAFGRVYQLAERTRVAGTASVAGEIYSRANELDAAAGEGRLSLSHKFGLGDAPWARVFVGGGYQHVEVHQRRGPRFTLGTELGKRLSPRFDARLSYRYAQRWGPGGPRAVVGIPDDVFDQQSHAVELEGAFLASESLLLRAGFGYQRGDFDSNVIANRVGSQAQTKVEAVARDRVFGGWVYRIEGNSYMPFASLGWGFHDRWSVDAGYRFRYTEGHGLSYRNHSVRAALMFRY